MRALIFGLAALVVTSPFAQAAGDSIAGRTVMVKCQSCHGKDGLSLLEKVGLRFTGPPRSGPLRKL